MSGVRAGIALGCFVAGVFACAGRQPTSDRAQKLNLVTNLWTQIRGWRHEAGMGLDPAQPFVIAVHGKSVKEIERVCPEGQPEPKECGDVCSLADAICDNAEAICDIAAELGNDRWAADKCVSAKGSCKEAQQRCCKCKANGGPP